MAIRRNNISELTILPKVHKPIGIKWVCKIETSQNGKIKKYKAKFVTKVVVNKKVLTIKKYQY